MLAGVLAFLLGVATTAVVTGLVAQTMGWGSRVALRRRGVDIQIPTNYDVGRTYFPAELDMRAVADELGRHPPGQPFPKDPVDPHAWRKLVFATHGGVPQLGPVKVRVVNETKDAAIVNDVRSVVLNRTSATFAAKYDPPFGGPLNAAYLAFDLDEPTSPGVLVDPEAGYVDQPTRAQSYFKTQASLEIPAGTAVELIAWPQATGNEVVEWTLEFIVATKRGLRGRWHTKTYRAHHANSYFRGVSASAKVAKIYARFDEVYYG
jgi:hypothetical protein